MADDVPPSTKSSVKSCIDSRGDTTIMLDLSFKNAAEIADVEDEEPRMQKGKEIPMKDEKFMTKSIRLSNNMLADIKGLGGFLEAKIDQSDQISWLDLSHNLLTTIDPSLCDLRNLQILYLHANRINSLGEVDKLAGLAKLKKLTLHGNPIEDMKEYRCYVLCTVRDLRSFDFSGITKADRSTAATWESSFNNKRGKKKKKKSED